MASDGIDIMSRASWSRIRQTGRETAGACLLRNRTNVAAAARQLLNDHDRWSLPRRLAERREFLKDDVLDAYIKSQMRKYAIVWGIWSNKYAETGSYSALDDFDAVNCGGPHHSRSFASVFYL
jgi:hypothetical protein